MKKYTASITVSIAALHLIICVLLMIVTIYSKSDRCIYELTLEHLTSYQIGYGIFLQHIAFLSFITMVNVVPELYLKASVFTVGILHAKG